MLQRLRQYGSRATIPSRVLRQALNVAVLAGALTIGEANANITAAAAALFAVSVLGLYAPATNPRLIAQLSYFFLGTVIISHLHFEGESLGLPAEVVNAYFIAMAVLVAVGVRVAQKHRYAVSTLDFLVLFLALVVPNLPELPVASSDIAQIMAKLIVFYYCVDFVFSTLSRRTDVCWFAIPMALGLLAARAVI